MPQSSLEQEALDRVAKMYSSFDRGQHRQVNRPPRRAERPIEPEPEEEPKPQEPKKPAPSLTELLMQDKEQSLILLLLVILMKDGADLNLILALLYLVI